MSVLLLTHPAYHDHDVGPRHVERPARLTAVLDGINTSPAREAVVPVAPRAATAAEISRVHPDYPAALERFCAEGGGRIDVDTMASPGSWPAAVLAAGAGPSAVERLDAGEGDAAFLAVRPPGHHARTDRPMGFCLLNNVAITAAALAERGERVLVVDYDVHHGNGTQEVFFADDRVAFVSIHQDRLFPAGSGDVHETGSGRGTGLTVNVPMPPRAAGAAYRAAVDVVVVPFAERFVPDWVLVSAGFDAHRDDPLSHIGLTAGDFADITARIVALAPAGRRLAFLEGGYDLDALAASAGACVAALAGECYRPEPPTSGGPGLDVVDAVRAVHGL